jgi:UDP-N-acetylmuramoylalanine--D-glutamate ligase
MIDLFPFSGLPVAVLGLGPHGIAAARSLSLSGAEVLAWDDDPAHRAAAAEAEVPLRDLTDVDWREPVSLVIEHDIPHGESNAHAVIAAARSANCEIIADSELLARAQRDAAYVALVSRDHAGDALDIFEHVLQISGRETEVGGDQARPLLALHGMDLGGVYVIDMPPARADVTVSITFDAAVYLDLGSGPWPPCATREETVTASRWVFHRQTGPKGAVVSVDGATGRQILAELSAKGEQIVIPISGQSRTPGGVYVVDGVLYDDIAGNADAVTDLPLDPSAAGQSDGLLAASVYATAIILNISPPAAMASLRSYFID